MKSLKSLLDEIEKDCLRLKRGGYLTEYGQGQLDLIKIIKDHKRQRKLKTKKVD